MFRNPRRLEIYRLDLSVAYALLSCLPGAVLILCIYLFS